MRMVGTSSLLSSELVACVVVIACLVMLSVWKITSSSRLKRISKRRVLSFRFCSIWKNCSNPVLHVTEPTTCFRSSERSANSEMRAASFVRKRVLSSRRAVVGLNRSPSGHRLLSTDDRMSSNLSVASKLLAVWTIRLLVAWLTHGAPRSLLMSPRRNHCDLFCKSNTSSSRWRADARAGYSDCFSSSVGMS
uniref:Putative secreted protein n=1 Tax=Anopheles darlingi TaxID=43151 RepID=A0A2M4DL86_ANODA